MADQRAAIVALMRKEVLSLSLKNPDSPVRRADIDGWTRIIGLSAPDNAISEAYRTCWASDGAVSDT